MLPTVGAFAGEERDGMAWAERRQAAKRGPWRSQIGCHLAAISDTLYTE